MHRFRLPSPVTTALLLFVACNGDTNIGKTPNDPPAVVITSPPNGSEYDEGDTIAFSALVEDDRDAPQDLYLFWSSDRDGVLAEGSLADGNGTVTFVTGSLSPGNQVVTLSAVDADNDEGLDYIELVIADLPDNPDITVLHPIPGEYAEEGESFEFSVIVGDEQDVPEDLVVDFFSDRDGTFCTENADPAGIASCDYVLSVGEHFLTFDVTDLDGLAGQATAYFEVISGADIDDDGDGYTETQGDCDDNNPTVHPTATEYFNGIDDDCDGITDEDTDRYDDDGDGFTEFGGDCDDTNPQIYPGAPELCDKLDNDCDKRVDEGTICSDDDLDGYTESQGDCDDASPYVHPGAPELEDLLDNDCDTFVDEGTGHWDDDGDCFCETAPCQGSLSTACAIIAAHDCNDADTAVNPAAIEMCDAIDNDCDGLANESDAQDAPIWYADLDLDGYGDLANAQPACAQPAGFLSDDSDCDDANPDINPDATEICNALDDNCDGFTDEPGAPTWYLDTDADGYGSLASPITACTQPAGYVASADDCDDTLAIANPGAAELCDLVDNDCDGTIDEPDAIDATIWYIDIDQDLYGDGSTRRTACLQPLGYVSDATDCDDLEIAVNPGAAEMCNSVDDNCNGVVDESTAIDARPWYLDSDGDTYGSATQVQTACNRPSGYVSNSTDCNDANAAIQPGATEICNALDDDCDSTVDEGVSNTYYRDSDSDGYGNPGTTTQGCSAPSGYVANSSDCDDGNSAVKPGATERCNSIDDDCDGGIDESDAVDAATWYADTDGDNYGNASSTTRACRQPPAYVSNGLDCNDSISSVYPGASEYCNSRDDNCNGSIDETPAVNATTWYLDGDADGYGRSNMTLVACNQPTGYVGNSSDCNDANAAIKPGATEICNLIDDDCDSQVDEGAQTTYYRDADGDSYGNASVTQAGCTTPTGYVANSTDCNDSDSSLNPATRWYIDYDADTYGLPSYSVAQCTQPSGYVRNNTDCNDNSAAAHPGATESCDTLDNDCDGSVDEQNASGCRTYYYDADGDGYGTTSNQCLCAASGYYRVTNSTDCYDGNGSAYPGQAAYFTTSRGDGSYDYNCDGTSSQQYTATWSCYTISYCFHDDGWYGGPPACGVTGTWSTDCYTEWHWSGPDCHHSSDSSRTQSCR